MSQSIKDAIADAETLRVVANELSWDDDLAYSVLTLMGEAEMEFCAYQPEWTYRRMAHAALEAVPGLRS
jgi:hypothetical protein